MYLCNIKLNKMEDLQNEEFEQYQYEMEMIMWAKYLEDNEVY